MFIMFPYTVATKPREYSILSSVQYTSFGLFVKVTKFLSKSESKTMIYKK